MSIAEMAPLSTRPPSKYWLRYISCQREPVRIGSRPIEKLTVVLDGAHYCALAIGHPRLAPAVEPFVGLDLDDQLVPVADPDRIGVNGGYLHGRPFLFFRARLRRPRRCARRERALSAQAGAVPPPSGRSTICRDPSRGRLPPGDFAPASRTPACRPPPPDLRGWRWPEPGGWRDSNHKHTCPRARCATRRRGREAAPGTARKTRPSARCGSPPGWPDGTRRRLRRLPACRPSRAHP